MNEEKLQNLKLINNFLLIFKLLDKTRKLYGIPSGNIFIKSIREASIEGYKEFQKNYIEQLYSPFTVLQKLEEVELSEHAFEINHGISDLLKTKEKHSLSSLLPNRLLRIEEGFCSLSKIPDFKELEETIKTQNLDLDQRDIVFKTYEKPRRPARGVRTSHSKENLKECIFSEYDLSTQMASRVIGKDGKSFETEYKNPWHQPEIKDLKKLERIRKREWKISRSECQKNNKQIDFDKYY